MRQEAGMRMPKETALWERMHSRSSCLRSTPDDDGTGASLGQQLGQQGHVVAVASYPSPFTIRPFMALDLETTYCSGVHVYSQLICRTGSQILKLALLLK